MRAMTTIGMKASRFLLLILAAAVAPGCAGAEPEAGDPRTPFEQQVSKIADVLRYKDGLRIEPVPLNGGKADSAVLIRTTWELKSHSQFVDDKAMAAAMKLPEAERLKSMNRTDDHIQVWAVAQPAKTGVDGKAGLVPVDVPHRFHRELFYLGQDKGFAWYGFMQIYDFVILEKKLSLDGEDILPALIRGVAVDDRGSCTRNSCKSLLGQEGAGALSAIDKAIAEHVPQRARLVGAMLMAQDQAVTRWLIGLTASADAEVAPAARWTLLRSPRKEAMGLYVQWLAEGAGKREVRHELAACRKLQADAAAASLPKVIAAPASVYDYRQALELSHELAGKPAMPKNMLAAEKEIIEFGYGSGPKFDQQRVDRAVATILAADAPAEAAAIGMSLAVYVTKGSTRAIHRAGIRILRGVPGGEGKRLARLLARSNQVDWQAERVKAVARELGRQ